MRILIVEDEGMIALNLQMLIGTFGHEVMGPIGRLKPAMELVKDDAPDAVLLDVGLHGEMSFPLADLLIEKDIPFVFVTAYDPTGWPMPYRVQPLLSKPVTREHTRFIVAELARMVARGERRRRKTIPPYRPLRTGSARG